MLASKRVDDRRCRWCDRRGYARRGKNCKRVGLSVTNGECEACHRQALRCGRDKRGRPLSAGQRKVTT